MQITIFIPNILKVFLSNQFTSALFNRQAVEMLLSSPGHIISKMNLIRLLFRPTFKLFSSYFIHQCVPDPSLISEIY